MGNCEDDIRTGDCSEGKINMLKYEEDNFGVEERYGLKEKDCSNEERENVCVIFGEIINVLGVIRLKVFPDLIPHLHSPLTTRYEELHELCPCWRPIKTLWKGQGVMMFYFA